MNISYRIFFILFFSIVFGYEVYCAEITSHNRFTITEGLSNNSVNVVFQDSNGFLWIGTEDGLNRYDGYSFKIYRFEKNKSNVIAGNRIVSIAEDNKGNIWIGTRTKGLSVLNPVTDNFKNFRHEPGKSQSLPEKGVFGIYVSPFGEVWIKTENYLSKYLEESEGFQSFGHYSNVFKQVDDYGYPVLMNSDTTLLIGTKDGLNLFNKNNGAFDRMFSKTPAGRGFQSRVSQIIKFGSDSYLIGSRQGVMLMNGDNILHTFISTHTDGQQKIVNAICESSEGTLWVGTNRGLEYYVYDGFNFHLDDNKAYRQCSVIPGEVTSVIEDASGIIWVGTRFSGLFKLSRSQLKFSFIGEGQESQWPLESFNISSIYEDDEKLLWLGTLTSGLYSLNRQTKEIKHFIINQENYFNNNDGVHALYEDSAGVLWIGSNNGIYQLNKNSGQITEFCYGAELKHVNLLKENLVTSIVSDSSNTLWFGTRYGLYGFNGKNLSTFFKEDSDKGLLSNEINALTVDLSGRLWVGTAEGLNFYDRSEGLIKRASANIHEAIFEDQILSIACDERGFLWLGTRSGLLKLQAEDPHNIKVTAVEGLLTEMISSVMPDSKRGIWVSSSRGVSMKSVNDVVRNFDVFDGLPGQLFNAGSSFRSKSGELFFGSVSGVCWIHPDSINYNLHQPQIAITQMQLCRRGNCESVFKNSNNELRVKYSPGMILEVDYAALEFSQPQRNSFKIMLQGYDSDWREVTTRNNSSFSNLLPGRYKLRILASNSDFTWNNIPYEMAVIVIPPLWMTNYAYAFYLLAIIFIVQILINYRVRHYKQANKTLTEKNIDKKRLEEQRSALSRINQNLTDSINYATRIQGAMIPTEKVFREVFSHSFIYFRPKDLVSGDFYWLHEQDGKIFVAAVDCTGHGVPGAFMSIIGMDLLKNIVVGKGILESNRILEQLSFELNSTLRKNDNSNIDADTIKDGMDMSLCVIDLQSKTLEFSGAVNDLYLFRNGELQVFKGDRLSIGRFSEDEPARYSKQIVPIIEGDMIYVFTDGYADQFGGSEQKKFKYRRFRHLLLNIHTLPPDEQKATLHQKIEEWKGSEEQVDDILVMGFKPFLRD